MDNQPYQSNGPFSDSYNNRKYNELVAEGLALQTNVDFINPISGKSVALASQYFSTYSIWLANAISEFGPGHEGVQKAQSLLVSTCQTASMTYFIELTRRNKSDADILIFALGTNGKANIEIAGPMLQYIRQITWKPEEIDRCAKTEAVYVDAMLTYAELLKNTPKQGCYIATMVYGSYDAPEVLKLRRFRDQVLCRSSMGKAFINLYYWVSPFLVNHLERFPIFPRACRILLESIFNLNDQ